MEATSALLRLYLLPTVTAQALITGHTVASDIRGITGSRKQAARNSTSNLLLGSVSVEFFKIARKRNSWKKSPIYWA